VRRPSDRDRRGSEASRDQAIRDFQALTAGIESRVRLAQGAQPDRPRDEQ
jgi:hypothetical protein